MFWASFNLSAILCLIRFIFTLCSVLPELDGSDCLADAAGAGLTAATGVAERGACWGILACGGDGWGGGGGEGVVGAERCGDGGGGGGEAEATGLAASGALALPDPAVTRILRIFCPGLTVAPSSTRSSSITPLAGELMGTEV